AHGELALQLKDQSAEHAMSMGYRLRPKFGINQTWNGITKFQVDPTKIRELRGDQTRAAFAAKVGVDPHTIYRWELDPSAPQARRPRGKALAKLRELARDAIESPGSAGARSDAQRRGDSIESPGSAGARSDAQRRGDSI